MATKHAETHLGEEELKPKQEVAERSGSALELYDPGDDAGAGMENVGMDEQRIPFLRVLDPKSPQARPVKAGGLPGAKGGALFNTSTQQVFDGEIGIDFVPCFREQKFIEYIKREEDGSGGGFVAVHEPNEPLIARHRAYYGKFGKMLLLSDDELAACIDDEDRTPEPLLDDNNKIHELVQTFSLFGIAILPDESMFRCICSFASTQIRKYQGFIGRYDAIRYKGPNGSVKPALWAHKLHLSTQYESKGSNSWYGWNIRFAALNEDGTDNQLKSRLSAARDAQGRYIDPLYSAGREFYQMITSGEAKVDYSTTQEPVENKDAIPGFEE